MKPKYILSVIILVILFSFVARDFTKNEIKASPAPTSSSTPDYIQTPRKTPYPSFVPREVHPLPKTTPTPEPTPEPTPDPTPEPTETAINYVGYYDWPESWEHLYRMMEEMYEAGYEAGYNDAMGEYGSDW